MVCASVKNNKIKNINSPFTEVFSILTKCESAPDNSLSLAYSQEEICAIKHHVNNALDVMLHGMQEVGQLLATAGENQIRDISLENIGYFISSTCNLVEAMRALAF